METGVAICSVAVPPLFSDNFDFQTKDDFIRGLLMNDEILESSVYCYYLPNAEYAASATSWDTYHSIR
jgi:translation initiation factor eIF-2B subunit epsilon